MSFVFNDFSNPNCAILAPLNEDVLSLNQLILDKIPGEKHRFFSVDEMISNDKVDEDLQAVGIGYAHSLTPCG